MSHVPHELAEDFPESADKLHALKTADAHFAKLSDEYHEINREIHRIETNIEPASDMRHEELRKKRMMLKDQISVILSEA